MSKAVAASKEKATANLASAGPPRDLANDHEFHSRASDAGSADFHGGSRASDAGSDSASDARSTATMETTMSAGTLASGASTAFYSQQVHFFSLDDFAGHEIQTILEDGETEQTNHDEPQADGQSQGDNQSVRPGSIVSNIEQRLDEIEGLGPADIEGLRLEDAPAAALLDDGSFPASEAEYLALLQQMQHRELTPDDLRLLRMLEHQRAERHRHGGASSSSSRPGHDPWGGSSATEGAWRPASGGGGGGWSPAPPLPPSGDDAGADPPNAHGSSASSSSSS